MAEREAAIPGWRHRKLREVRNAGDRPKPLVDYVHWSAGGFPAVNRPLRDLLEPYLAPHGAFLPVQVEGVPYWIYLCTTLVDAFDEANAEFSRFRDGAIWDVYRYAFHADVIRGLHAFKYEPRGDQFISGEVADALAASPFLGWQTRLVWTDEPNPP